MATTTEKYYILQNEQGMFLQGLCSHDNGENEVKSIGLEFKFCDDPLHAARGSHPSRVRGLKSGKAVLDCQHVPSHPSRVRGLKYHGPGRRSGRSCRTLRGCVDGKTVGEGKSV